MVSIGGVFGLGLAALISFALPVIAYLICYGRMNLRLRNIVVGAGCFIVFVLVLEGALNAYVLALNPTSAAWFRAHPIMFAAYGALAAGLFEETARFLGMSSLVRKEEGTGVAYGIGHGGAEAMLIGGLNFAQLLAFALLLNQGKLQAALGSRVPPGTVERIQSSLEHLTFIGALPGALERASALVLQIALSLLVWRAVRDKKPVLYIAAIVAHTAADAPAALLKAGAIHISAWPFEAFYAAVAGLLLITLLPRLPARGPRA